MTFKVRRRKDNSILFISRGRGRGHAARDLAIASCIMRRRPTVQLSFASYGDGLDHYVKSGVKAFDLMLSDEINYPETVVRVASLIKRSNPQLVVAQEEPGAVTASTVLGVRAVFTTHWFAPKPNHISSLALRHATCVLFMEEQGIFVEPVEVHGRVHYCGPVLRKFRYHPAETDCIRRSLGLDPTEILILVLPGSPHEKREPIFDLVRLAFERLEAPLKRLIWIAGVDYDRLRQAAAFARIEMIRSSDDIERLILASSLVITKGTYNIGREIMALGRRSISLTHNYNAIDDLYAARWPTNVSLKATEICPDDLAKQMLKSMNGIGSGLIGSESLTGSGANNVAIHILDELEKTNA